MLVEGGRAEIALDHPVAAALERSLVDYCRMLKDDSGQPLDLLMAKTTTATRDSLIDVE